MARQTQPPAQRDPEAVTEVTVLLMNGGFVSTAIGPIEVFHAAGKLWNEFQGRAPEPRFRVTVASLDGEAVTSAYGLALGPHCAMDEIAESDLILVASSSPDPERALAGHNAAIPWLQRQHARGAWIGGVCSGVAYLAEAGLLDGRRATTHWGAAAAFRARYPRVRWQPELLITEEAGLFCSGGVYAAVDLSLYLVQKLCGQRVAIDCAKSLLVDMPRVSQAGYAALPLSPRHDDPQIRRVEDYLNANYAEPQAVAELAAEAGMSERTFLRRFKAATGKLPVDYLQALRVAVARSLLEEGGDSVQQIGFSVGYGDTAFFRRLFKRHTGLAPSAYRERYRNRAQLET